MWSSKGSIRSELEHWMNSERGDLEINIVKEKGQGRDLLRDLCEPELREGERGDQKNMKKRKNGTDKDKIIRSRDKSSHQDSSFKEQEVLSWECAINLFLIFRGKFSP